MILHVFTQFQGYRLTVTAQNMTEYEIVTITFTSRQIFRTFVCMDHFASDTSFFSGGVSLGPLPT